MADKITVEDINTWLLKYNFSYQFLILDCSEFKDYGTHEVYEGAGGQKQISLNIPINIKAYAPKEVDWWEATQTLLTFDSELYVILNQSNNIPICYNRLPYWLPLDNPNVLALKGDLNHKLYISINEDYPDYVQNINGESIKQDSNGTYITYNALNGKDILNVEGSDIEDMEFFACNLQTIASAPIINVSPAYRGNTNKVSDLISLPSEEIEYTVYYQGRNIDETLYIPKDYDEDNIRLRVVTKSYEPYIAMDIFINVPVETKALETLDDLNNYNYGYINELNDVTGEINTPVHLISEEGSSITNSKLIINSDVTFENISEINNCRITVNNLLQVTGSKLTPNSQFLFDNNGNLTLDNCISEQAQNLIINKGTLNILNSEFKFNSTRNYPMIHSEIYPTLQGNKFVFEDTVEGYGVCIIRTTEINTEDFLKLNTTDYNCMFRNNETDYHVQGNGIAYCQIDNDTIIFTRMEVQE